MNVSFLHMMSIWLNHLKKELNDLKEMISLNYGLMNHGDGLIILQNILNSMEDTERNEFKEFLTNKYGFTFQ